MLYDGIDNIVNANSNKFDNQFTQQNNWTKKIQISDSFLLASQTDYRN